MFLLICLFYKKKIRRTVNTLDHPFVSVGALLQLKAYIGGGGGGGNRLTSQPYFLG